MGKRRQQSGDPLPVATVAVNMERVRINTNDARPTYYFKRGGEIIRMDIDGRRICRQCGGKCLVVSSPTFASQDGSPKRIQHVKCTRCGVTEKFAYSMAVPYTILCPEAKDHPMAGLLSDIAALADAMLALTDERQQEIVEQLSGTLDGIVDRTQ